MQLSTPLLVIVAIFVGQLVIGTPADAQSPVCLTIPADSPLLSSSPDDIPATGVDILTYTGSHAKARANMHVAFVQTSANEQKVWFAIDSDPPVHRIFYNRRYRADGSSPWYWEWSVSPAVTDLGANISASVGAVLFRSTPTYKANFTPNEGFILSRINGQWNLNALMKISPIRETEAMLIFYKLWKDGVIAFD